MILSFTRRFIFVHIYRTGGTSVFYALSKEHDVRVALRHTPFEQWPAQLRAIGLSPEILDLPVHTSAAKLRAVLGQELYGQFFKFAFVRNPWDHALSHYLFVLAHPQLPVHAEIARYPTFRDYILGRFKAGETATPQRSLIADETGKLIVDFVGRYENLPTDFGLVCDRIGLKGVALMNSNETQHEPWSQYYDLETFDRVRMVLRGDIATFGYSDDPASYGIGASASSTVSSRTVPSRTVPSRTAQ